MKKFIMYKNFLYVPIPKCACTSLKHFFYTLNYDQSVYEGNIHNFYPTALFKELPNFDDLNAFTVVRNPIDRFISAFTDRVLNHRELKKKFLPNEVPINVTLKMFIEHFDIYYESIPQIKHHFRPQSDFIGIDKNKYVKIFSFDNFKEIPSFLDLPKNQLPHKKKNPMFKNQTSFFDLEQQELKFLKKFYEIDYDIYGDFFNYEFV